MTTLLQHAVAEAEKPSAADQDAIASWLLAEFDAVQEKLEERGGFVPTRGPERIGPGPMREERMLPPVRDDRMAPPPMRDDRPMAPPPPMPPPMRGQPPMPAPTGGGFGRFDDPRYDEPTGTFGGGGGFDGFEPGRHGKMDMTTEIRMPADVGPPAGPPMGGGGMGGGGELHRIDQLRRTFVPRRFGSGYDPAQVDRLFEGILQAMSSGRGGIPINDAELDPGQFNLVPGGYFEAEVDQALREVRDILLRRR